MADAGVEIEEIESLLLISSQSRVATLSSAYAALLHFQERSANDPSAIQALGDRSQRLLPLICCGAACEDEEIASQALKCLGFMIYHPSLVSSIPDDLANLVVECLVKLITTTKVKAICNLGVWCISIQQFNASFLATHLHSLLRALIHALDNPFGSLSTTFEAIQAVMKLACQSSEMMRDMSNIWVPPLYRRLLSTDKRERDMSERCLLKTKSSIFPPKVTLSKALAVDLKKKLLPVVKDMIQDHGRKLHIIQAWGWYIRLLGLIAGKNRHLINEMLKIPEQTFSDTDPQVQIATQVAWEGLIDALIQPPLLVPGTNTAQGHNTRQNEHIPSSMSAGSFENLVHDLSKRIKLIMTPILGVISSKCDISVRSSCLNTWHYFLHKLDLSVNHASVIKTVLEPILEVIFRIGLDNKSIWMWKSCVDLLDEFASSKLEDEESSSNLNSLANSCNIPTKTTFLGPAICKGSWKDYPIKWLPWDFCKLDFHLKMIRLVITPGLTTTANPEHRKLATDASLRIFRTVLKGVQVEFAKASNGFNQILLGISSVLNFIKWVSEEMTCKCIVVGTGDLPYTAIQFVELVKEELEPSILASPLFRIPLDLKYINDLHSADDLEYPTVQGINFDAYMEMVSPMVCLTTIYLFVVAQSVLYLSEAERIMYAVQYSKFIFSSCDPLENLLATIYFLYTHRQKAVQGGFCWLNIWKAVSGGLKEHIHAVGNLNFLKTESDNTGHLMVYWFLCYPYVIYYSSQMLSTSVTISGCGMCPVSTQSELELELVIQVWKSLFDSANRTSQLLCSNMNSFCEGLCKLLITVFREKIGLSQGTTTSCLKEKKQNSNFLSLFGEVATHLLTRIQVLDDVARHSRGISKSKRSYSKECIDMKHISKFVARFLKLSINMMETDVQDELAVVSRFFAAMANFVGCLFLKQDVLSFLETISEPLDQWLSLSREMLEGDIIDQLELFWTRTLDCLKRVEPVIIFDSAFLSNQALLLQTTLDHPYLPISEATISFWKSSYGDRVVLSYPQCLLPVLDKLSKEGRITFHRGSSPLPSNDIEDNSNSAVGKIFGLPQRLHKRNSEGLEFIKDNEDHCEHFSVESHVPKQKRYRSMEVRLASQDREWDGRETYNNADFVKAGHELRNSKLIIDMLRRVR